MTDADGTAETTPSRNPSGRSRDDGVSDDGSAADRDGDDPSTPVGGRAPPCPGGISRDDGVPDDSNAAEEAGDLASSRGNLLT